jgi:hypothetical protein
MSQPKLKLFVGLVIILIVIGAVVIVITDKNPKDSITITKKTTTANPQSPAITASPNDVAKQLGQHNGKVIALKGQIYQISGVYYVVGAGKTPSAVKLDFSKSNVDPVQYANVPPGGQKAPEGKTVTTKGDFTVTGQVSLPKGSGPVLVVTSIK